MHSTKKGKQMKIPVGVDRESKRAHSLVVTPANVHDSRKEANRLLSKTRSCVEHIFLIAKRVFAFSKIRFKRLPKITNFIFVRFVLSNLYMLRRDSLEPIGT